MLLQQDSCYWFGTEHKLHFEKVSVYNALKLPLKLYGILLNLEQKL